MQLDQGITKFKCATIAEAEMVAACGAPDVLLAYQPVGPNVNRLIQLVRTFPGSSSRRSRRRGDVGALSAAAVECGRDGESVSRSGLRDAPDRRGARAGRRGALPADLTSPGLHAAGLHATTGIFTTPIWRPYTSLRHIVLAVLTLRDELVAGGLPCRRWSPAALRRFPSRAACLTSSAVPARGLLGSGYSTTLPDLDFLPAVLLLTRVVSKPGPNLICLDLGHKAVASEDHLRA